MRNFACQLSNLLRLKSCAQGEARASRGSESDGDSVDSQLTREAQRQCLAGGTGAFACPVPVERGIGFFIMHFLLLAHLRGDLCCKHKHSSTGRRGSLVVNTHAVQPCISQQRF